MSLHKEQKITRFCWKTILLNLWGHTLSNHHPSCTIMRGVRLGRARNVSGWSFLIPHLVLQREVTNALVSPFASSLFWWLLIVKLVQVVALVCPRKKSYSDQQHCLFGFVTKHYLLCLQSTPHDRTFMIHYNSTFYLFDNIYKQQF